MELYKNFFTLMNQSEISYSLRVNYVFDERKLILDLLFGSNTVRVVERGDDVNECMEYGLRRLYHQYIIAKAMGDPLVK